MPTFNFMAQFVDKIEDGSKGGTIRAYRRYPTREGQTLYLQTGPRFKPVRLKSIECVEVWDVEIKDTKVTLKRTMLVDDITFDDEGNGTLTGGKRETYITLVLDTTTELNAFAKQDGFESWSEMKKFWKGGLPFRGFNARWIPLKQQVNVQY